MLLKIQVLSTGAVLLDGRAVELRLLEGALTDAKEKNGTVWYYREAAPEEPPAQAVEVMNLIVRNKLPVSLSSKPDFSDYVDAQGVSHPRGAAPDISGIRMPEVELRADIDGIFAQVRKMAAGEAGQRGLVLVKPNRKAMVMPPIAATPAVRALAASMDKLIPAAVKRNVAAVAYTVIGTGASPPGAAEANRQIPFFGLLLGMSFIGHAVWIFEGHDSALEAGCRHADLLIVDSAMRPFLVPGWEQRAASVMRNANIMLHDRSTYKLAVIRKVGQTADRLEFLT